MPRDPPLQRTVSTPEPAPGAGLQRRFEACVANWDDIGRADRAPGARPLRATIEALCAAGFDLAVLTGGDVDRIDDALGARPAGPGRLLVGVGGGAEVVECGPAGMAPRLRGDAGPDAVGWIFADLWDRGIAPGDVLVAGDVVGAPPGVVPIPGGPDEAWAVLEEQLRRRQAGQPPAPRPAAGWCIRVDGIEEEREHARAAVLTVGDGCIGTTGAPLLSSHPAAVPETRAAGFYDGEGPEEHLRPLPAWNQLGIPVPAGARLSRVLDLRTGVVAHDVDEKVGTVSGVTFSSLAEPGTAVLWAAGSPAALSGLKSQSSESVVTTPQSGSLGLHVSDAVRDAGGSVVVERIAVTAPGGVTTSRARAEAARGRGVIALHRAHRESWAARWADADIALTGDEELQRNVRYSLFQLMGAVATTGEAPLGARGLSGDGYKGHVFWDSDVFVVPFLAATCPAAARAMVEYRVRRIGAAMEQARALGRQGAKYPWESASSGREITPATVLGPRGETVVVRTGEMEEHIVADVAWAACRYVDWTADEAFARGALLQILVETARYWASRIERADDGSAHIRHVIGPDEYHDDVDDNAFTNVMARWNLRAAASRAAAQCDEREVHEWSTLADRLVDELDPASLVYEEFAGFSQLTPFPLRETYGPAPFAANSVIGFDRIQALQVVKQADVLMLHLMIPDEVPAASLLPNLDRYLPITAHGSSLSPAVHAALLARVSRHPEALDLLGYAARIDVDDAANRAAHGLHVATMGGLWLAMVEGFAGLQADGDGLCIRPRLPATWEELSVRLIYRGVRVHLSMRGAEVRVKTDRPLRVVVAPD